MSYEYGSVKVTVEARPENMSKALDFLKAVKPAYDQEMLGFFIQDWERAMAAAVPAPAGRNKFVIDEFYDSTYPVVYGLYELGKAIPDLKLRVTMKIANSVSDIKCTMTMEFILLINLKRAGEKKDIKLILQRRSTSSKD